MLPNAQDIIYSIGDIFNCIARRGGRKKKQQKLDKSSQSITNVERLGRGEKYELDLKHVQRGHGSYSQSDSASHLGCSWDTSGHDIRRGVIYLDWRSQGYSSQGSQRE